MIVLIGDGHNVKSPKVGSSTSWTTSVVATPKCRSFLGICGSFTKNKVGRVNEEVFTTNVLDSSAFDHCIVIVILHDVIGCCDTFHY